MSILRYEQPVILNTPQHLPTANEAWRRLALSIGLPIITWLVSLIWLRNTTNPPDWSTSLLPVFCLLLPLLSQAAVGWWVVRPMWQRCRRTDAAPLAVAALLIGLVYHLLFLSVLFLFVLIAADPEPLIRL